MSNSQKRRAIFEKHRIHADFLILQETHSTPEVEGIWQNEWGGKAIFSHGTSAARGVGVFISKKYASSVKNVYKDIEGRIVVLDVDIQEELITIAAIYAPNEDSPKFFVELGNVLRERQEHKIIIGDFNLTLNVELDRENTFCNNNRAKDELENLNDEFNLRDIWRLHYGEKREFSWFKRGSYPIKASRIDLALISAGLDQKVEHCTYLSSVLTDHRALYVVVEVDPFERGTGYWKFNCTLLQKADFVKEMNKEIDLTLQNCIQKDAIQTWEVLKKRIKACAQKYARESIAQNRIAISQLSEKLNEYESSLPLDREENELMEKTREELEEKTLERIQGIMFRSKAKWYEQGERSTKYFYSSGEGKV